jgi:hypothetical protein
MPSEKDEGQLSTSRSEKVSAAEAFEYHTQVLKFASIGTYAISVGEVIDENLRAVDDSDVPGVEERPPGHTT